jgi:D-arginine dehydrogenase
LPKVVVIGGGIAGVSAGYYLAEAGCEVTLLEAETTLAYHSTGRSAALYFESYGAPMVRVLTRASREFFERPRPGLAEVEFLAKRGALWIGRADQIDSLEAHRSTSGRWLTPAQARRMVPGLRPGYVAAAIWEPEALDLDVAAIHQAFVRGMRSRKTSIRVSSRVSALTPRPGGWTVEVGDERVAAEVVVNAAGAWCDLVALMAGVEPIGLQPCRRTAFMVPGDLSFQDWPLVADIDDRFYFRPDGSQILCSPADETPVPPGDARPQEIDVALTIERINAATTLDIKHVRSAWAGLRSFVADRSMVIGFDRRAPGFFWLAGQGGTGIQTAPAAGALTAALITIGEPPSDQIDLGLQLGDLAPERLR